MPGALHSLLMQAGLAMAPLQAITTPDQARALLRKLGYDLPLEVFGGGLAALSTRAGELIAAMHELAEGAEEDGTGAAIDNLLARLVATVGAIRDVHAQIQAAGGGALPDIADLPRRLTDFLVLDFLDNHRPGLHATLHVLGLVEHEPSPPPGQPTRLINWDRFGLLVTDPGRVANDVYRWDSDFDAGTFLSRLGRLMRLAGLPGGRYPQTASTQAALGNSAAGLPELRLPIFQRGVTPEAYSQFGITFSPVEARGAKKAGLALLPYIMGGAEFDFPVGDRHELVFESTADLRAVGLVIQPPFSAEGFLNLTSAFRASVTIREKSAQAEEIILIGSRGGTRLAIQGLGITWFVEGPPQELDLGFEAEAQALRLVIAPGESDGFLQQILSGLNVQAEARLAFGMTLLSGFTFKGGAKLTLELGTQADLGPVRVEGLRVSLAPAHDHVRLEVGTTLRFKVGPVAAVVEHVGLRSDVRFQPGNLGPADLDIRFKPPSGVGLSVDAGGVVTGGGFLFHDEARGLYAGRHAALAPRAADAQGLRPHRDADARRPPRLLAHRVHHRRGLPPHSPGAGVHPARHRRHGGRAPHVRRERPAGRPGQRRPRRPAVPPRSGGQCRGADPGALQRLPRTAGQLSAGAHGQDRLVHADPGGHGPGPHSRVRGAAAPPGPRPDQRAAALGRERSHPPSPRGPGRHRLRRRHRRHRCGAGGFAPGPQVPHHRLRRAAGRLWRGTGLRARRRRLQPPVRRRRPRFPRSSGWPSRSAPAATRGSPARPTSPSPPTPCSTARRPRCMPPPPASAWKATSATTCWSSWLRCTSSRSSMPSCSSGAARAPCSWSRCAALSRDRGRCASAARPRSRSSGSTSPSASTPRW